MAKTLTLRLTQYDQEIVNALRIEFNQSVASKAILRACRGFLDQKLKIAELEIEIALLISEKEKLEREASNTLPKQLNLIEE
jgi:hypothetical protein